MILDDAHTSALDECLLRLSPNQRDFLASAAAEARDYSETPWLAHFWHAVAVRVSELSAHEVATLAALEDSLWMTPEPDDGAAD